MAIAAVVAIIATAIESLPGRRFAMACLPAPVPNRTPMNLARWLLLSIVVALAGCTSKVTAENYDKIAPGMSRAEVHALLGKPDDSSATDVGGVLSLSKDTWKAGPKTLTVTFGNDSVALKSFE